MLKLKPATILSILSFSISLFILGFYILVLVHLSNVVKIVNEKTPFIVEMKDGLTNETISTFINELKKKEGIVEVKFISKAEGLKILQSDLEQNIGSIGDSNPLKDVLKIKLDDVHSESKFIADLQNDLKLKYWVENTYYEKDSVEDLKNNLNTLNSVLLIMAIIFIILSLILIYNNLRFLLHADRHQIKTMELIGASPTFVRRPYMKLAVRIGFMAAVISIFLILILLFFLNYKFDIFNSFFDLKITILVLVSLFIVSIATPPIFINYLVVKYLKMTDQVRNH